MIKSILQYYLNNDAYVLNQFIRHFLISVYGVLFAAMIFIPLGFYLSRKKKLARVIITLASTIQTIPSLAMISLLMIALGIGVNTVVVCVFLYSILPILENTYTAVTNVDEDIIDVALAMGMTPFQVLWKVELPLSLSIILGGIRNALVLAIGITAIGTFIGAGGLGDIITRGINLSNGETLIWAGTIPAALMAVGLDIILGYVEKKLSYV